MVMLIDPQNLPGACDMGVKDAQRYLVPTGKRSLTIQEALNAGMPALWIAWFLSTQTANDETALPILLDGAARVAKAYGVKGEVKTAEQALLVLNEVVLTRVKEIIARDGHARDARTHAFDEIGEKFAAALTDRKMITMKAKE